MNTVQSVASAAQDIASGLREFSEKASEIAGLFKDILAQAQAQTGEAALESKVLSEKSTQTVDAVAEAVQTAGAVQDNLLDMLLAGHAVSTAESAPTATEDVAAAAVNLDAVKAATDDPGVSLNGLVMYLADPTSNAWRSENVADPVLRRYLDSLPLSRESTLEILSAENPLAEIGNIYRSMGSYATVDSVGDLGGKSISIRDNEGRILESQLWMPDKDGVKTWTENDANTLQLRLAAYGVDVPDNVNWTDFSSVASALDQKPPAGKFNLSPAGQYERYGFKTDPLTGAVVGGGSTSAIEYYSSVGQLPPASAVWQ